MKLTIDNGAVTCSLEDKNATFLAECSGMFDGFLNGKLKLYDYMQYNGITDDGIIEGNADIVASLIKIAGRYGVEVTEEVKAYSELLQKRLQEIIEKQRLLEEEKERAEKWERLCKHGCGKCPNLTYYIDVPKCKKTRTVLKDKPVPTTINGIMFLFNMVAFPNDACPFNNKKQGV